jgi:hypothetical protein
MGLPSDDCIEYLHEGRERNRNRNDPRVCFGPPDLLSGSAGRRWRSLPAHAQLDWPFIFARSTCLPDSGRYDGCTDHDQNNQQCHCFSPFLVGMRRTLFSVFVVASTPLLKAIPASCEKSDLFELPFGPQPIVELLAGMGAALEIDLVCAEPNLVLGWLVAQGCFVCLLGWWCLTVISFLWHDAQLLPGHLASCSRFGSLFQSFRAASPDFSNGDSSQIRLGPYRTEKSKPQAQLRAGMSP